MATVKLRDPDRYDEDLPDVCMKCGAPATVFKRKTFAWHPGWVYVLILVGLLPFAIVALVLTKRMKLRVPLCDSHRNHWLWRTLVLLGSFIGLLVLPFVAFVLVIDRGPGGAGPDFSGLACLGPLVGLVAWLILAAVLSQSAIRALEITDRTITLTGVSREFKEAYLEERPRISTDLDREARERWREVRRDSRRDDDRYSEDDKEPRRRSERFREEDED